MIPGVRGIVVVALVLAVAGCASLRTQEQRTTEGPMAEDIWTMKVLMANGREPNFDERRRWDNAMEQKIGQYLRQNPDSANSVDVSTFRFVRQVSVGPTPDQVLVMPGPARSTLAGSGTMLVHLARPGETVALDFNGCAPMRAHDSMFRLSTGISRGLFAWPNVENAANERGWLAVAVPGSVAGLSLALERYGTMELRDVIKPAVELARGGFVADWYQALSTARQLEELAASGEAARV